ncbi:MAG: TonB-dependent receptor [Acidobacteriota bacterium]
MIAAALAVAMLLSEPLQRPTSTATLRGAVVRSDDATPLPDARVSIVELGLIIRTTADGRFAFAALQPGTYTVTVSTISFIFVRRQVQIGAGADVELVIPLAEGTGTYQEAVTVIAPPSHDVGTPAVNLGSAALQDLRGVLGDDPVRAVQALPGVATGSDFQAEFSVRGSAFRHVGVIIDGTATPLLFHAVRGTENTASVAMINTDVLSRASLSAGPHPQRHGDWLGATLEFDVREGSRDRAAVRGAVSGTNTSLVVDGPIGRSHRGSWLMSVRRSYVEWLVRKIDPAIEGTIGFSDAQHKLVYDVTARQRLELLVIGGTATYRKPSASGSNDVGHATSSSALASTAWTWTRDRLVLQQRLSFVTNHFDNTGSVGQQTAHGVLDNWMWRSDVLTPMGDAWRFEGGARIDREHADEILRNFASPGGVLTVRAEQRANQSRAIGGAWAQLTRQTTTSGFTAGVRVATDGRDRAVASPWMMAERELRGFIVSVGGGRTHQFATLIEVAQGADASRPERADGLEARIGHDLPAALRLTVAGFGRRESNILRRVHEDRLLSGTRILESTFPLVASDLTGKARGVDLTLERRATSGPSGWIGYSWAHTRDHDRQSGEDFDGDFDQRHTLNLFVQQRLSYRMNASVKIRYGSNFPLVGYFEGATSGGLRLSGTRNAVRLPAYARLDVRASRTFTYDRRRLTLFLEVMNATGHDNFGQTNGSIRNGGAAVGYTEHLIPVIPSAGVLLEF